MGNTKFEAGTLKRWIHWAGEHPGLMLLGALMIAVLTMQPTGEPQDAAQDSPVDDVPLFV
jgi:hypothetical protein